VGENSFLGTDHDDGRVGEEARCASCGGLVAPDAEWCGQCFSPLRGPVEPPTPRAPGEERAPPDAGAEPTGMVTPGGGAIGVVGGGARWDCPVCGEHNPIEASVCGTCRTPFARLFDEPTRRPEVAPRTAALWSLAFAGLGQWKAGYRADGVARIVLFAWTLGTVLIVLASRSGKGGLGSVTPLFALYLGSAVAIYALSAVDAYRVADGALPLVSSRVLLWASAALVLVSIALATLVTLPAARG
jgi:hypothetical protein